MVVRIRTDMGNSNSQLGPLSRIYRLVWARLADSQIIADLHNRVCR